MKPTLEYAYIQNSVGSVNSNFKDMKKEEYFGLIRYFMLTMQFPLTRVTLAKYKKIYLL